MPFTPKFTNLVSMLQKSVAEHASRPLFGVKEAGQWKWYTYAEFGAMVDQLRSSLSGLGVKKGDRVAIIANNRLEWAVGAYATYGLGAAYVPMYETQQPKEWHYILNDCGAKVCFAANDAIWKTVSEFKKDLSSLEHVVNLAGTADDASSYRYLLQAGTQRKVDAVITDTSEVASFIYTSGTTGNPKGVLLSHMNLASNVSGIQEIIPLTKEDRSLSFLPWAHIYGCNVELNGLIALGASMAICEAVDKIIDNLAEVRPTVLFAVPRIWNRIYDGVHKNMATKPGIIQTIFHTGMRAQTKLRNGESLTLGERIALPLAKKLVFSKIVAKVGGRLKYACSGAAALSKDVGEFIDNLGITIYEGYGMTESSPVSTSNSPQGRKIGSVGRALPGVTVKLDHNAPGSDAENGEIVMYGPNVMLGYHNLPEETAKVLTEDGGLRSGDLGRFDKDGYLYITGRVKELYKLENGKYVAPAPLEEKITLSPYIAQVMIHGANKPYNVALIVPDMLAVKGWAEQNGVTAATADALLREAKVQKLFEAELDKYGREFKTFERVKKFVLISEEFSTQNDLLTPTLKVKRRNVLKRYENQLNTLWQ